MRCGDKVFLRRWLTASVIVAVMVGAMAVIQLADALFDGHIDAVVVAGSWCDSDALFEDAWDAEIIEGPETALCVIKNVTVEVEPTAVITVRRGQNRLIVPSAMYIGPAVVRRLERHHRPSGRTFAALVLALLVVAVGAGWVVAKVYRPVARLRELP